MLLRLADGGERALIDRIKALAPAVQKTEVPRWCSTTVRNWWRARAPTVRI